MKKVSPVRIAALLVSMESKGITENELYGFQQKLIGKALTFDFKDRELVDVCGTGGDNKNTINISTLSAFVLAGAGYNVAKHGNFKFSSSVGSSDILSYFGAKFTNDESVLRKSLDTAHFCYVHAPLFHSALKNVGPIRKTLGIRTFLNLLGPLSNPLRPKYQVIE